MTDFLNRYQPRYPNYMDVDPENKIPVDFNTLEELMEIPQVKHCTTWADFKRFSISDELLMAETTEGKHYAMGYISHPELINLPKWEKQ